MQNKGKQCKSSISSTKALPKVTRHTQNTRTVPLGSVYWHQSQWETFELCILQKNRRGKTFYLWFMITEIMSMIKCTNMKCCLKLITPAMCDPPQSFISSLCNMYYNSNYFDFEGIYTIIISCHNNNLALAGFSCLSALQIGFNSHCVFQLTLTYLITRFNFKCHLLLSPRSGSSATCSQWSLCTGLNKLHLPEVDFSQHPLEYIPPRKRLLGKCRSIWIIPSLYFLAYRSVSSEIHVYHITSY